MYKSGSINIIVQVLLSKLRLLLIAYKHSYSLKVKDAIESTEMYIFLNSAEMAKITVVIHWLIFPKLC